MIEENREATEDDVEMVHIDEIKKDTGLWPRIKLNQAKVQEYREKVDQLDPVLVARSDVEALDMVLVDGFHRHAAYEQDESKTHVPCRFIRVESRGQLLARATRENTGRALPLSREEKKMVATRLDGQDWDESEIAKVVGRSERTVYRWLTETRAERDEWLNNQINRLRDEEGLSFAEIGRKVGLHRSNVSRRYRGEVAKVTDDKNATDEGGSRDGGTSQRSDEPSGAEKDSEAPDEPEEGDSGEGTRVSEPDVDTGERQTAEDKAGSEAGGARGGGEMAKKLERAANTIAEAGAALEEVMEELDWTPDGDGKLARELTELVDLLGEMNVLPVCG